MNFIGNDGPAFTDEAIASLLAVMPDSVLPALLGQTIRRLLDGAIISDVPGISFYLGDDGFVSDACTAFSMNVGQMTTVTDERENG